MHLQSNSWGTGLSIAICLCHYLEPLHSEERFLGTLAAELEQQEKSITFIPCGWVFERNVVWSSDAALTDYSFSTHGSEDANIQWQLQLGKGSLLVKLCLKNNLGGGGQNLNEWDLFTFRAWLITMVLNQECEILGLTCSCVIIFHGMPTFCFWQFVFWIEWLWVSGKSKVPALRKGLD